MLVQIVTKPVIGESERERESDGLERRRMRGLAVFFYTLVFVANAALIMMLMVGVCFFVFCFFWRFNQ